MDLHHAPELGEPQAPSQALETLFSWAVAHGAKFPKIMYPVSFAQGLQGVQATEYIGPDEDIVSVPLALLLSCDCAESSPIKGMFQAFPLVFESNANADTFRFIAYLMFESQKGPESYWFPVLETIPSHIETLSDWLPSELQDLQDPVLSQDAHDDHSSQQRMWAKLKKTLESRPDLYRMKETDFSAFRRWYGVITTRCFGRYRPSAILCPVADFLNHGFAYTYYDISPVDGVTKYGPGDVDYDDVPGGFDLRPRFLELAQLIGAHFSVSLDSEGRRLKAILDSELEKEKWEGPFEISSAPGTCFRIRTGARESYAPGAQVFLFYGNYSNRQLLLSFGFAIREDRFSYYSFLVPISELLADEPLAHRLDKSIYSKSCRFKLRRKEICLGNFQPRPDPCLEMSPMASSPQRLRGLQSTCRFLPGIQRRGKGERIDRKGIEQVDFSQVPYDSGGR